MRYSIRARVSVVSVGLLLASSDSVFVPHVQGAEAVGLAPIDLPPIPDQAGRTDRFGDVLPSGASARLGTSRFRHAHLGTSGIAFSPNGKLLATCGRDGCIKIWEFPGGALKRAFWGADLGQVFGLAFSADGSKLIASCDIGLVRVFDARNGEELLKIKHGPTRKRVCCAVFSPDGSAIASAGEDGHLRVWNSSSGEESFSLNVPVTPGDAIGQFPVAFSPDGLRIAAGHSSTIIIVDASEKATAAEIPNAHGLRTISLAFTPDSRSLVSGGFARRGGDAEIRVWTAADGNLVRQLPLVPLSGSSCSLSLSGDGTVLASSHDNCLVLREFANGRVLRIIHDADSQGSLTNGVALSADGKWVACITRENQVRAWKTEDASLVVDCAESHYGYVNEFAWFPTGKKLVSASADGSVRMWDVDAMRQIDVIYRGDGAVRQVLLAPDANTVVIAGEEWGAERRTLRGVLRMIDLGTKREVFNQVQDYRITAAAVSDDGLSLAAASGLGESAGPPGENPIVISVWDIASRMQMAAFSGHKRVVLGLRFSADAKMLLSVAEDGSIRRWDIEKKQFVSAKILKEDGRTSSLQAAAFSANLESVIGVGRNGGTLSIRRTDPGGSVVRLSIPEWKSSDANVALSPDGRLVALDDGRGQIDGHGQVQNHGIWLIDATAGRKLHEFKVDERPKSLKFSLDGTRLACGTIIGTILIYDVPENLLNRAR